MVYRDSRQSRLSQDHYRPWSTETANRVGSIETTKDHDPQRQPTKQALYRVFQIKVH